MKARYTLLVAALLLALPFAGLIHPTFAYDPGGFAYGSFVSSSGRLLQLSAFVALLSAVIFLLLPTRLFQASISWRSAAIHVAICLSTLSALVAIRQPLSHELDVRIGREVMKFFDQMELGTTEGAVRQAAHGRPGLYFRSLNDEGDRLAGFPVNTGADAGLVVAGHGTVRKIALWFRNEPETAKGGLVRKALFDKNSILAIDPQLKENEDRVLVGVLSSGTGTLEFMPCGTSAAYVVSSDRMSDMRKYAFGFGDAGKHGNANAILQGRIARDAGGTWRADLFGFEMIGGHPSYDQEFYDTCHRR